MRGVAGRSQRWPFCFLLSQGQALFTFVHRPPAPCQLAWAQRFDGRESLTVVAHLLGLGFMSQARIWHGIIMEGRGFEPGILWGSEHQVVAVVPRHQKLVDSTVLIGRHILPHTKLCHAPSLCTPLFLSAFRASTSPRDPVWEASISAAALATVL